MSYDVVVVGAGPAGCAAGSCLGAAGLHVAIVEKADLPREKVCGNLISGFCLSLLEREIPDRIVRSKVYGARIVGGHEVQVQWPEPIAISVRRAAFDAQLLQWALDDGAACISPAAVASIGVRGGGCETVLASGRRLYSKYVIGADGALGVTGRYVRGGRLRKWAQGIAFVAEIPRDCFIDEYRRLERLIYLDVGSVRGGYAWIFPQGDVLNIGVGSALLLARGLRDKFDAYVRRRLCDQDLRYSPRAHPLPLGGIPRRICRNRVLLTGDAAGVIDPISGEGVSFAIRSGQLAARAIIDHRDSPHAVAGAYRSLFRGHITRQLRPLLAYYALLRVLGPVFAYLRPEHSRKLFDAQFRAVAGRITHRRFVKEAISMLPGLWARNIRDMFRRRSLL